MIQQEKAKALPSADKITSCKQILDFITNADTPDMDELSQIEEIFCVNHLKHKHTKYPTTKSDKKEFAQIIMQIKMEIEANPTQYSAFTVPKFFEMFMNGMDMFWIRNQFSPFALNKHFRSILGAVKTSVITGKSGRSNKLSYEDVLIKR